MTDKCWVSDSWAAGAWSAEVWANPADTVGDCWEPTSWVQGSWSDCWTSAAGEVVLIGDCWKQDAWKSNAWVKNSWAKAVAKPVPVTVSGGGGSYWEPVPWRKTQPTVAWLSARVEGRCEVAAELSASGNLACRIDGSSDTSVAISAIGSMAARGDASVSVTAHISGLASITALANGSCRLVAIPTHNDNRGSDLPMAA